MGTLIVVGLVVLFVIILAIVVMLRRKDTKDTNTGINQPKSIEKKDDGLYE